MLDAVDGDFTQLLADWRRGDAAARERVIALAWPELRAVAGRQLAAERRGHTLQPTALVNEAYLRLSGLDRIDWNDRAHFVRVAAKLMREILVDHARRRSALKRDGGERITLDGLELSADEGIDVVGLDAALTRLEEVDATKARIVELRYFGGLTIEETAEAIGASPATVKRHWQAARAWLFDALGDQR